MYCCFTGHRPEQIHWISNECSDRYIGLKNILSDAIDQSIDDGYTDFFCGMARGIDTLAAQLVLEKSVLNPSIKLHAALPCPNQHERWPEKDKELFENILSLCDSKTLVSPFYTDSCMLNRNKFMVDNSQRVIAVWNGYFRGGTAFTVRYAKKRQREIFLIRPNDLSLTII